MTQPPPITAPTRLTAEVFHRAMTAGRNGALLIGGRSDEGELVDCVAKLPGLMENPTLHPLPSLLEWLGTTLARELGVETPTPYELVIDAAFAAAVPDERVRAGVVKSAGSVFGSQFVRGAQMLAGDLIDPSLRHPAALLMAFDVFIHNFDRRAENPNMFVGRDAPVAFDHGDAFAFVWPIVGAADPVTDPLFGMLDKHAFGSTVRRGAPPDLTEFRRQLVLLDDARLAEVSLAAPSAWQRGLAAGKLQQILDILRRRRDALEQWLPQVEAWMRQ